MKILVCGGRDFYDEDAVFGALDQIHQDYGITTLVHGAARGADYLAERWAKYRQVNYKGYPAKWNEHGRGAGPVRNREMLEDNPNIAGVVAFPGGVGTNDMVSLAKQQGIAVWDLRGGYLEESSAPFGRKNRGGSSAE